MVTKWVGEDRNPEILIPIDAARSGDLENLGFGKNSKIKGKPFFFYLGSCAGVIFLVTHNFQL